MFFFFNGAATTEIYTLSLHDALPIWDYRHPQRVAHRCPPPPAPRRSRRARDGPCRPPGGGDQGRRSRRSEENTSELQSRQYIVCRFLLEKKHQRISPLSASSTLTASL